MILDGHHLLVNLYFFYLVSSGVLLLVSLFVPTWYRLFLPKLIILLFCFGVFLDGEREIFLSIVNEGFEVPLMAISIISIHLIIINENEKGFENTLQKIRHEVMNALNLFCVSLTIGSPFLEGVGQRLH